MIDTIGLIIVALAGLFLLGLGVLAFLSPTHFEKFLLSFAQTPRLHFLELALRALVGIGFLLCWPLMQWGVVFRVAAWILIITTLVMLFIPWEKHRQFANWGVPQALRFTPLLGTSAILMGILVLWALVAGKGA